MQHAGSSEQLEISAKTTKRQLNLEGIIDDDNAESSQIFRNISIEGVYTQDASFKLSSQNRVMEKY